MRQGLIYSSFVVLFFLTSCKEDYEPPVITTDLNYLVVDGTLTNGPDSTIIRLSRTSKLGLHPELIGEYGAQVTVEDVNGNTFYNLSQTPDNTGAYGVPSMQLDVNQKYRLRIITTDGNQFLSDDIPVKQTPPIDTVSWQLQPDGAHIFVSSHDPQNNTKYYRWEYSETWQYHSVYFSLLKFNTSGTTIEQMFPERTKEELIYDCWKTQQSSGILLGTTAKLSADFVNMMPVRFIPVNSAEINYQYSINVKQFALSKEAFDYFENIKKITEEAGSLFDAQPSQLDGNIHCVGKPNEHVIGFVTASSLQQQRIFITNDQVNPWRYETFCSPKQKVSLDPDSLRYFFDGIQPQLIPIEDVYDPQFSGINGSPQSCVDCRVYGGNNVKPDFWP